MRHLVILLFLLPSYFLFGQDTIFYHNDKKVSSIELADSYEVLNKNPKDTNEVLVRSYFKSGKLKAEIKYANLSEEIIADGTAKEWYENGQLSSSTDYKDGEKHGQFLGYWENGNKKQIATYEHGTLVKGIFIDTNGKQRSYTEENIEAEFPGGMEAMISFISKELRYPQEAVKKNISGRVFVEFIIDKEGNVGNIKIDKGVHKLLDAEAMRVVKKMPKWNPAQQNGEAVQQYFNLPISFTMSD